MTHLGGREVTFPNGPAAHVISRYSTRHEGRGSVRQVAPLMITTFHREANLFVACAMFLFPSSVMRCCFQRASLYEVVRTLRRVDVDVDVDAVLGVSHTRAVVLHLRWLGTHKDQLHVTKVSIACRVVSTRRV